MNDEDVSQRTPLWYLQIMDVQEYITKQFERTPRVYSFKSEQADKAGYAFDVFKNQIKPPQDTRKHYVGPI